MNDPRDIYSILLDLDETVAKAALSREEHATAMQNVKTIRDFIAMVAEEEMKGSKTIEGELKADE